MNPSNIICFADGGPEVGTGHLFRTKALCDRLNAMGSQARMLASMSRHELEQLGLSQVGSVSSDPGEICGALAERKPRGVILDTYRAVGYLCRELNTYDKPWIALFDDHYAANVKVNFIINGSPAAELGLYSPGMADHYLLGPKYAALSIDFREKRQLYRLRKKVRTVIVALGGVDVVQQLSTLITGLDRWLDPGIRMLVIGAKPAPKDWSERVSLLGWLSQYELASTMLQCDLAVLGGGSMLHQAACMGVPVISWPQHENQRRHASIWEARGTIIVANRFEDIATCLDKVSDYGVRRGLFDASRQIVDGLGSFRICECLLKLE